MSTRRRGAKEVTTPQEERVRILHLVSTFEEKTDTKWLLQLFPRIDRSRFELAIAAFYGQRTLLPRFAELGVRTYCLDAPGSVSLKALRRAIRVIWKEQPDIVHTHLLRADLVGALAARWVGTPVILTTCYALGEYRRAVKRRLDSVIDRVCRRLPNHVLAVSQAVKDDCVQRLGWNTRDVSVIHTGVHAPSRDADWRKGARDQVLQELELDGKTTLIVAVARLSYEKGIPWLIEAAKLVLGKHTGIRCLIVGDGPMRTELQDRINRLALSGHVSILGFRSDVATLLAAADVVVLPSLMEGMPNVLLEAWAASAPVVASKVGGLAEVIESEKTGLLVPPKNAPALAHAIVRLITDRTLSTQLGEQGYQQVQNRFSVATAARKYENLYLQLTRERREHHDSETGAHRPVGSR